MDLKLLRTFVTAAKLLNFHQAAERLYLTQPTVTSHVRQLEETLGYPLFERVSKRVRLTPAGERFLPHATRVIETYEQALHDMTSWRQGYSTRLNIMASPVVASSVLPGVLKVFTAKHPRVEVIVLSAVGSQDIPGAVAQGTASIGLSRAPSHLSEATSEVLYWDPVILVACPSCLDEQGRPPDWHDLLASQLLLTRNHPMYWDDLLFDLSDRQHWLRTLEVDRVDVTKRMVEEGLGVSFLPRSAVTRELHEGKLVEVLVPDMELPVAATYLILPVQRSLPEPAHAFIAMLYEAFPERAQSRS